MGSASNGRGQKVGIVTGAASGMGFELAHDLIRQGWNVACFDVNEAAGQKVVAELGDQAIFIKALWANAGVVDRSSIYILNHRGSKEIPPAPDVATTMIDYVGVVYGTQLAIHFMRQNPTPGGQIVATASIAGIHPHSTYPEYCGAKAGV